MTRISIGPAAPPVQALAPRDVRRHRTLFLSDLHLGARACRADRILDFLEQNSAETTYLIGDIFDVGHATGPFWSDDHDRVVQLLLRRAQSGDRVVYLLGNHDLTLHRTFARHFDGIELAEQLVHRTADGRSLLVLHGHTCDAAWQRLRFVTRLGSRLEDTLRSIDGWLGFLRRGLNAREISRIEAFLGRCNALLRMGNAYERRLTDLARGRGHHGVVCGHFHQAALHESFGLIYANCGDWVHAMSAITEDETGNLALVAWAEGRGALVPAGAGLHPAPHKPAAVR